MKSHLVEMPLQIPIIIIITIIIIIIIIIIIKCLLQNLYIYRKWHKKATWCVKLIKTEMHKKKRKDNNTW